MVDDTDSSTPLVLHGLIHLPHDSTIINDADEEVFLAYTRLSAARAADETTSFRGLGHVNSRKDAITVTFELKAAPSEISPGKPSRMGLRKGRKKPPTEMNIEVDLVQDTTSLRSRPGDTGSVLWKASIALAKVLLQQHYYPVAVPFLDPVALSQAHVLELGAGTGLLSILFSPMVRRYTVTDNPALLPLIRKNVSLSYPHWPKLNAGGGSIVVEELDWAVLQSASNSTRLKYIPYTKEDPPDLVLVVDCIYNPSLLRPLVDTIDCVSVSNTTIIVVSELRAEAVVREFLAIWLDRPGWRIWSTGSRILDVPYAVWVASKA